MSIDTLRDVIYICNPINSILTIIANLIASTNQNRRYTAATVGRCFLVCSNDLVLSFVVREINLSNSFQFQCHCLFSMHVYGCL